MAAGDPGERRVRKPSKTRTFQPGRLDPEIEMKRPLLTWGNAVLVIIMLAFGLYATGNLPQVDEFFNYLDKTARSHNNGVVTSIIMYVPIIVGIVILLVFGWFIFLFVNSRRRQHSDEKGWHRVTRDLPDRPRRTRREDEPSLVMPLGKERRITTAPAPSEGDRRTGDRRTPKNVPATEAVAEAEATPEVAAVAPGFANLERPVPVLSAREKALLAAAKAEAAADAAPPDLPSFVVPVGKQKKAGGGTIAVTAIPTPPAPIPAATAVPPSAPPVAAAAPPQPVAVPPPAPAPDLEAAAQAAQAAQAMAAAQAEVAKAELAMALARAEAAKAELALLTAKQEAAEKAAI